MAISFLSQTNGSSTSSSITTPMNGIFGVGDVGIVTLFLPGGQTVLSIVGGGAPWTLLGHSTGAGGNFYIYSQVTASVSGNLVITLSASALWRIGYLVALNASGNIDTTLGAKINNGSGINTSSGTITTGTPNCGVLSCVAYSTVSNNPGNNNTAWTQEPFSGSAQHTELSLIASGLLTNQSAASLSLNNSAAWTHITVAFTPSNPPVSGAWASTETHDTMSIHGGLVGGPWVSTEATDMFAAVANPITGTWRVTELSDTFFAKAVEIDSTIIQTMLFPLSMSMTAVESIPVRITTTLPGFNQVMEVEEVPQTYFVTAIASTTLPGFGQLMLVKNTDPIPITVAQEAPPGRGGGGAQPTISIEKELADLFHGRSFNRGIDSAVPSTRVAAGQLTTPFSPRPITQPPRRRK